MRQSRNQILHKINRALMAARQAQLNGNVENGYLPVIIESLEAIRERVSAPQAERDRMAGGLGRIVTDDYAFAESDLGLKIFEALNAFIQKDLK